MSVLHTSTQNLDWPRSSSRTFHEHTTTLESKRREQSKTYPSGLPTPPLSKAMPGVVLENSYAGFPGHSYQQNAHAGRSAYNSTTPSRVPPAPSNGNQYTVVPPNVVSSCNSYAVQQNNTDTIAPHLQIPESVNKSKGSLAEFLAELTCLFWFETATTLQQAEDFPIASQVDKVQKGLLPDAIPSIGFRKWVTTIISTTQVGKNVVLLALLFIYRLKRFNPSVSGKRGSEFRLLTIALMLGNKFLDDNTYTNKTWAEVSGISVTEIHIMEVEFLSNMRYDLHASAEEWSQWKAKLGRFGAFYDKASQLPTVDESRAAGPVTPTSQSFTHKLPSPPSTHHSLSPFASSTPSNNQYPTLPHPLPSSTHLPSSPLRQHISNSSRIERKRSLDHSSDLPPAKRQQHGGTFSAQSSHALNPIPYGSSSLRVSPSISDNHTNAGHLSIPYEVPRLDIPRIPASMALSNTQLAPLSVPASRAMSTVYPVVTNAYSQPVTPISAIPQNLFQNPIPSLGDGSRQISQFPSAHTSPNGYHTTTPTLPGLSPSYFLTHRTSPYRPVRHVNTLLIPPPSAAMQGSYRNIPADQIHYQPLSKVATERRNGPLPFMPLESWQHSNASTPTVQQQTYQF